MPEFRIVTSGCEDKREYFTKIYKVTAPCAAQARIKHDQGYSREVDCNYGDFDHLDSEEEVERVERID